MILIAAAKRPSPPAWCRSDRAPAACFV